jgi:hypothetical protein
MESVTLDHPFRAALDCRDEGVRTYVTCCMWDNRKSRTESL